MTNHDIEDLYKLSPLQQGILFHSLAEAEPAAYMIRIGYSLRGALDTARWEQAWQQVAQRNPILRTSFHWDQFDWPLQAVHASATLPIEQHDWRTLPPAEQERRLAELLTADRRRGFVLTEAPLTRLTLIRLENDRYQFYWSVHHILLEGWSISLLLQELLATYRALCRGEEPRLPARPRYRDYIMWLEQQDSIAMEAYWRDTLKGFTAPTPLPGATAAAGSDGTPDRVVRELLQFGEGVTANLQTFARQQRVTVNTVLQGAWALLLAQFSGEQDVVFGSVLSGRPPEFPGAEAVVGLCVNTLPARVQIDPRARVGDWLRDLQARQVEMRQYEYSPLPQVQRWSAVPPGTPIFESIFAYENWLGDLRPKEQSGELQLTPLPGFEGGTGYPLTIEAVPGPSLTVLFSFSGRRFDAASMRRVADHYGMLIEAAIADASRCLGHLPLLTAEERERVLVSWNATDTTYPDATVAELFEAQAARTPDAVAAEYDDRRLTYRQLNDEANHLALRLLPYGIGPDTPVGVLMDRSIDMVVGLLAIVKAGGGYVPLDPSYPGDRLAYMVADAGLTVVVSDARHAGLLADVPQVLVETGRVDVGAPAWMGPARRPTSDNLAYVMYTSGSTGMPKGVAITHRAIVRLVCNTNYVALQPDDRIAQASNTSFDAATFEIWGALLHGATLVGISKELALTPPEFARALVERRVTTLFLTTALFNQLAQDIPSVYASLRHVLFGGEAVDPRFVRDVLRSGPPSRLLHVYGPTETTTYATWHLVSALPEAARTVPIGQALSNTTVYVLDGAMAPVPVGVPGELYIGGAGLARGYWNRPALTAERFVPNPFGPAGGRLYRTGDRVRWCSDGAIEFLGRFDDQVKIRGFRIEPGEIEAALRSHPAVKDAVVVALEDRPGERRLVGYAAAAEPDPDLGARLRAYLAERLPPYMVPSALIVLPAFPLNPNGKVDRRALPAPEPAGFVDEATFVPPRNGVEEEIAAIWRGVLRVPRIGVHDNFFEAGGHSLMATQVISRVRRVFDVELPLREIFEAPTIASLAERIVLARDRTAVRTAPPVVPIPRTGPLPLSFAQQRLWFLDRLGSAAAYHTPISLRLTGPLNVVALGQTLTEIVRRHESLRTTFSMDGSEPVQNIQAPFDVPVPLVDLAAVPAETREAEATRIAREEVERPFDLSAGPIVRARLVRLGPEDHIFVLTLHHIAADGWSLGVLLSEWTALYAAFRASAPSPLPSLPVQYADFAVWQRQWLQGEVLEEQIAYWRNRLTGITALQLPTDFPRPAVLSYDGATHASILPPAVTQGIAALGRREGVTPYMVLLAAFQTLLARYSGQDDIVVGSPIANRTRGETEALIGFFVNSLTMRTDLSGDPSFREVLRRVKELSLGAYAHQDVPFEKVVDELQPDRDLSRNPLFQVSFAVQNAPVQDLDPGDLGVRLFNTGSGATRFDLELHVWERSGTLTTLFSYSTDLFRAETIERMSEHFVTLLESAVSGPERRVSELALLTPAEERQLVVAWNDTAMAQPADSSVQRMFEAQTERAGDHVAVECGGERLTYRALNARANRLAHFLRRRGVGPDTLVGLHVQRSLEMLVGILGVLKAGGAYVPLDPSYPADRLAFMVGDSGARVVLTHQAVPRLAGIEARLVCLDAERARIDGEPDTNPEDLTDPDNLAYVIYTSGSTGRPKGAMISRRGLANYLQWATSAYAGGEGRGAPVHSTIAFDLTVTSVFYPLLRGETVHLVPDDHGVDALGAAIRSVGAFGVIKITPAHLELLSGSLRPADAAAAANALVIGGEALLGEMLTFWRTNAPGTRLINEYGPTETVVGCCVYDVPAGVALRGSVPIGRPIANTRLYVVDRSMNLVPLGVPGELYIGGVGVARGYWGRPDLTAERFVPDRFSGLPGERLYRSGDLARYQPDGTLEYLGRVDHQIKIRGYRIELGEIEAVLTQHPAVDDAAVMAREDASGDRRLVAYVVARTDGGRIGSDAERGQVAQWQTLYEDTYGGAASPEDASFDLAGWSSSYTGEPIPADEMREWVERTCDRILSLKPKRVLEIGCGTGLLLFRIAPQVDAYCGLDFSRPVIDKVAKEVARRGLSDRVSLFHRTAEDLSGIERGSYDVVILNSVAQYFPGTEYLARVLEGAAATLVPGGAIFVGDVRDLRLLDAYHASVQLHRATSGASRTELRGQVRRRAAEEEELLVAPTFFHAFGRAAGFGRVCTLLKRGSASNELTKFRFDAILSTAGSEGEPEITRRSDWRKDGLSLARVREMLAGDRPESLLVTNVPVGRLADDLAALAWIEPGGEESLGEWSAARPRAASDTAQALWALELDLPYHVEIGVGAAGRETCDVVCWRRGSRAPLAALAPTELPEPKGWATYGNNPLHGTIARRILPELREHLETTLPSYMVPSTFVVLPAMPLTPNGKVDRRALPQAELTRPDDAGRFVGPRTPTEELLARIWSDLLGLDRIGVHDSFFELGGHSLKATQLTSRIRDAFGVELTLRQVFEAPAVALQAAVIERLIEAEIAALSEDDAARLAGEAETGV